MVFSEPASRPSSSPDVTGTSPSRWPAATRAAASSREATRLPNPRTATTDAPTAASRVRSATANPPTRTLRDTSSAARIARALPASSSSTRWRISALIASRYFTASASQASQVLADALPLLDELAEVGVQTLVGRLLGRRRTAWTARATRPAHARAPLSTPLRGAPGPARCRRPRCRSRTVRPSGGSGARGRGAPTPAPPRAPRSLIS